AMRWRSNATMNEPGHYEAMSTSPLMPTPDACSSAEPAGDPRQSSAAAPSPAAAAAADSAAADSAADSAADAAADSAAAASAATDAAAADSARASATASPAHRIAVVIGSGGIGGALAEALRSAAEFGEVVVLGRRSTPALDLLDEGSIAACAR